MTSANKLMAQLSGHVQHGDHLCVVCDDPSDRIEAASHYVADAIRQNELVVYAADSSSIEALRARLESLGIDVAEALQRGALRLPTADGAYLRDGVFDPDRVYAEFDRAITDAATAGYAGCRFAGEPTWAIERETLQPGLIEFESKLNELFSRRKATGLCVYDRPVWPAAVVEEMLRVHPIVVVGDLVCKRNPYYQPRQVRDPASQVAWMLSQLREQRTQEARLEIALDAGRLGSWELDLRTDTAVRSARHDSIFGYERPVAHWGYEVFMQHVLPEDRPHVDVAFRQALEHHTTWHFECRIRRVSDGAVRWIEAHGRGEPEQGEMQRLLGIVADITERKELEQALRDADRLKDEFLATLAHELRNPLAPISNAVQLLRLRGPEDARLGTVVDIIDRQVHHLVRLVDDLLDVSRITTGRIGLQPARVLLRTVLASAVEASLPVIEAQGHTFSMALPEEPLAVHGDAIRLAQVFSNLLNNAGMSTPRGGRIDLQVTTFGSDVVVSIKDNGIGIRAEKIPEMFKMFVQGHRAGERSQGGLGIGLPLSKKLIELHEGSIEAHSDGPGHGSAFVVRLPLCAPAESDPPESGTSTQSPGSRRHILVVDDNNDAADSLAAALELAGHQVNTRYTGGEGLEAAVRLCPDVVILDIGLPDIDGYEVARRIRASLGASVRLIALTGWGQESDRQRARDAGFDEHRAKPVDFAGLLSALGSEPPGPAAN